MNVGRAFETKITEEISFSTNRPDLMDEHRSRTENSSLIMTAQTKRIRVEFLTEMWDLIELVSKYDDKSTASVLRELSRNVIDGLSKGNERFSLGPGWRLAWEARERMNAEVALAGDDQIDLSVLEVDAKNPSGFRHVYVHQRGFVAQGRDPITKKAGRHLGLFTTAKQAAWARYQHYRKHGMPYGLLEVEIEKIKHDPLYRNTDERWIKALAIHQLANRGEILPDIEPSEREWETSNPIYKMDS